MASPTINKAQIEIIILNKKEDFFFFLAIKNKVLIYYFSLFIPELYPEKIKYIPFNNFTKAV